MRISSLSPNDRPRERLFALGAESLADRELLALLLGSGVSEVDAITLAAKLIEHCGGLSKMARADPHNLLDLNGVGTAKAARIAAAFQLARRAENASREKLGRIATSADLAKAAEPLLRDQRLEMVVVISCDQAGRVLRVSRLTEGSTDRCLLSVRDVLATVLAAGGTAFGVAHNHPSGILEPSDQDRRVTVRLREGAKAVGLYFLDHLIIADREWKRI
jgi:DNA repair protein RadC